MVLARYYGYEGETPNMPRVNQNFAKPRGTMAVAGGASILTATGGIIAQYPHQAGSGASLLLFCISGGLALLTGLTKLYEVRCHRTPEYIAATALARVARRHTDPDRCMRLTLIDRALARNTGPSVEQLTALLKDRDLPTGSAAMDAPVITNAHVQGSNA